MARVLIIEDDGDLQQMLSLALNNEGYEVHYAFNGKEGYDKIISLQPDLIVLDLMMPVLNGIEVMKLCATNISVRDIPIVVMTAHGDKADMLESSIRAQGAREYLRKPFELAEMKRVIKRMLSQYPRNVAPPNQTAKGIIRLDTSFRTLFINDKRVATLSPTKADVIKVLIEAKGPVKREKLLQAVWGKEGSDAALEKTIQRLRDDMGEEGRRIQTTAEGYELIG